MWDDAVRKVQAIIDESEKNSHWFPMGDNMPPEFRNAQCERDEISIMFAGNLFISHSSYDSAFIDRSIVPAVRAAAGKRYFLLNCPLYSRIQDGGFQHALWIDAAMEACKAVIAVVSERSTASDWIKWECHMAQSQRHPIVICQVDETAETREFVGLIQSKAALVKKLAFHSQPRSSSRELLEILRSSPFSPGAWNGRPLGTPHYLIHGAADEA